jgi:hypothetical protein
MTPVTNSTHISSQQHPRQPRRRRPSERASRAVAPVGHQKSSGLRQRIRHAPFTGVS